MFQFSPFAYRKRYNMSSTYWVAPFGNLRIKVYVPLPEAYRSLSRPSSPVGTKASTVCPKKLDSMFEISHADLLESLTADQRSVDRRSSSFHALRILRSTYLPVFPPGICRKKFDVWESEYIQGPQERLMGLFSHLLQSFLQSIKSYYSPYGCQRADSLLSCGINRASAENGGPDRTRTYDPRLIKAVL